MRRSVAFPLALSATTLAALFPVMWQRHVVCTLAPVRCETSALRWAFACAILLAAALCLLALAVGRALGRVSLGSADVTCYCRKAFR